MTTTATSQLLKTIADFRERLLAREAKAAATMERYHQHTIAEYITPRLNKLYEEIEKKQQEIMSSREDGDTSPPEIPASWLYEAKRLETIEALISGRIDQFAALAQAQTVQLQRFGANLGLESAQQQLHDAVPSAVKSAFGIPSTKAIESLVGATQAGSPLADLFRGFGQEAASKASQALVSGVTLGNNPRAIAKGVQDALGVSRNRALTISRNESLRCYRGAALETYRANDDVVDKWRWTCAKSGLTCIACIVMDGKEFPLTQEFMGHVQDRCSPVPVTKSWEDILGPLGIDASEIPDTRPQIQTGEAWFGQQPEETQRQILGNSGYDRWKASNSKITLQDFVMHKHDKDWGSSIHVRPLKDLEKAAEERIKRETELKAQQEAELKAKKAALAKEKRAAKAKLLEDAKKEAEAKTAKEAAEKQAAELKAKKAAEAKAKREAKKQEEAKKAAQVEVKAPVKATKAATPAKAEPTTAVKKEAKQAKPVANLAGLRAKYPHVQFDFDGIDKKLHVRIAKHVDKLFTDYPEVAKSMEFFGSFATEEMKKKPDLVRATARKFEMHNGAKVLTNKIFLNPAIWSNEQKLLGGLKSDVAKGWLPKGCNIPEATITHEFGHSINNFMDRNSNVATQFQEQNKSLGERVSGYSKYGGIREAWAEAFSSLYHSPNRTQYAKNLEKLLKNHFGGK